MKLKDIVPCCLTYAKKPGNGFYDVKYYWIINGLTYTIDSLETKNSDFTDGLFNYKTHFNSVDYIRLSRYNFVNANETQREYDPKDNYLVLNLDNEVTIFDKFIIVHKTNNNTDVDYGLFRTNDYYSNQQNRYTSDYYLLGMVNPITGLQMVDLRSIFKDLIEPPVSPKPAELTLDEKLDDLVDEIMKDSRSMAIKKLKRMLNERL